MHIQKLLPLPAMALFAASAQAQLALPDTTIISGWNWSEYLGSGSNNIGSNTFADSLPSTISDLDADPAQASSGQFGTWFGNGEPRNQDDVGFPIDPDFVPRSSSLNLGLLDNPGDRPDNPQLPAFSDLGGSNTAMNPVFGAGTGAFDFLATPNGNSGSNNAWTNWGFQFAAVVTDSGNPGASSYSFDVQVKIGEGTFTDLTTVEVTETQQLYSFDSATYALLGTPAEEVTFRMNFNNDLPNGVNEFLLVDNAVVTGDLVPEPAVVALLAGLVALGAGLLRRVRRER
jgi:hypothetical protein